MANVIRILACCAFSFLSFLLAVLGLVSLGLASLRWGEIVSADVTLSEIAAVHGRYSRALTHLYILLGGLLLLTGIVGVVAGALLLVDKLRITSGLFTGVFLAASFLMATTYVAVTSLFWLDWTAAEPLVLGELTTRVRGPAYLQNQFQFRSYWDAWQTENRCCGVQNSTDFLNSAAASNASDPLSWLPDSCCNRSLPLPGCRRGDASQHLAPCSTSLSAALVRIYWTQIGVVIAIWVTFLCIIPVAMALFATCGDSSKEERYS